MTSDGMVGILGEFGVPATDDADIESDRSAIKSFVIYQLVNQRHSDGSGIGCGVYDEFGMGDSGGIHRAMCEYLFGFCFNPEFGLTHARAFGDYCLRAFREEMFYNLGGLDVPGTQVALTKLLGQEDMKSFWASFGGQIKAMLANESGTVVSYQYKTTYAERLPLVFSALDRLVADNQ